MFGGKLFRALGLSIAWVFFASSSAQALGSQPIITHLQTGATGVATSEFIAIYNNSDSPIDVTDWCVVYASASDATKTTLYCINAPDSSTSVYIEAYSYARFASSQFSDSVLNFQPDGIFSAGMSATGGHVRLIDKDKNEVDKIGWGTAASPESTAIAAHPIDSILTRKLIEGTAYFQDTNNNAADFQSVILETIPPSGLYEEIQPQDLCSNLDGIQTVIPEDYFSDEQGACYEDRCDNLEGLQLSVPEGLIETDEGDCEEIVIELETAPIHITELLPNTSGVDSGNEYIELYNPHNRPIQLAGYRLELGPAHTKYYTFTEQLLNPLSFTSFNDLLTKLTLPNSTASLRLLSPAGEIVSETLPYENPKDDEAWAFINDVWQYTNNPTPALANLPKVVENSVETDEGSSVADCGQGRYRHPETNRCRNIQTGDVELTPCDSGQVRNPETNRCRRIVASSENLVPCREGQERNPETNRCRNIVSTASALKPCDPGEERNPETNRCRRVASLGASTLADVQDVPSSSNSSTNWWILGGVLALAGAYGAYEWRSEIIRGLSRFKFKN